MFGLGVPELIIILVILLLLFGSTKLPKLSRSIGESARELREGLGSDKTKPKNTTTTAAADKPDTKKAA